MASIDEVDYLDEEEENYLFQINYLPGTSNFRIADFMKIFEKMRASGDTENDSIKKRIFKLLVGRRGLPCHLYQLFM